MTSVLIIAEPASMEADGAPPSVTGGAMAFDPAKKTIAELKAWLTEQGKENQVRPSDGS